LYIFQSTLNKSLQKTIKIITRRIFLLYVVFYSKIIEYLRKEERIYFINKKSKSQKLIWNKKKVDGGASLFLISKC
jgi:hypothetical protein